ncbi:MAG: hypothetical protein WC249_01225 [Patescibacteria group bacterium]|jgi:hypothetical protein
MSPELKIYIKLIIVLILFWFTGSFIDSALWFHTSYQTPVWVVSHLDIIWLALSQFIWPLLIVLILKPKFNTLLAFMSAACFGSLAWDLTYSLLTRGTLISDSMKRWFSLDDFGLVIGIPQEFAWTFHLSRLVIGGLLFFWLYRRSSESN